jgi:hypothetical protein
MPKTIPDLKSKGSSKWSLVKHTNFMGQPLSKNSTNIERVFGHIHVEVRGRKGELVYSTPTMTKELEWFEYTNDQKVIDTLYGIIRDDAKFAYGSAFRAYFLTEDEPGVVPTPFNVAKNPISRCVHGSST